VSARRSTSVWELAFIRHRTMYSLALILAFAAVWTSPTALTASPVPRIAVTVRVYQTAGLAFTLEQRALAEAETCWGGAQEALARVHGPESPPICDVPPGPSEFLLVVRAGGVAGRVSDAGWPWSFGERAAYWRRYTLTASRR
jgi:hypothetical protein